MQCECGGSLIEGRSCYRVSKESYIFVLEDIPAYKCTKCDKVLFTDDVVQKIQRLVNRIERDSAEIVTGKPSVYTYDYK